MQGILRQWEQERPELDLATMRVIGRILRASRYLERTLEAAFGPLGITGGGFDVLAVLRRSGPPYQLSPTALFNTLMLSSGTMTNRIDRLERAGLVERTPDPSDRRSILVRLTPGGRELIDAATLKICANEQLLGELTGEERAMLETLLSKLLKSLEAQRRSEPGASHQGIEG